LEPILKQAMTVMHARPVVVLVLILAGIGFSAPLRAQTLADVAKKEEERRKTVRKPAKVYTNKDLSAAPAGSVSPAPAPNPSQIAGEPSTAAADAAKGAMGNDKGATGGGSARDQAYWAGRAKAIQDKLDRDQTFVDALRTRVNSLTADFVNRDDPAQRVVLERERVKAVAELTRLQQDITNGKKALADLDEEARRAGVPPGWLR
jgi:hypothetical protein